MIKPTQQFSNGAESRRQAAIAYAEAASEPCKHGHLGCAVFPGGRCSDEWFSILGLDNDGEWIEDEQS
jgi:hypothetical protein